MYIPFMMTFLAGMSTLIGILPIFIKVKNTNKIISLSCAFASGIMLCLSCFDLIPNGIKEIGNINDSLITILICFSFVFLGIITEFILEKITNSFSLDNNLYRIGILSMITLIIHNIPEGIVTYMVSSNNTILGLSVALAIAIHNIPEGISIAVPIFYATGSKFKAIMYTLISAFSELFGAIITYLFIGRKMNNIILGGILLFTGGIMMALGYDKLLPTGIKYSKKIAFIWFIIGFIFMLISLQLNNLIS